MRDIEVFAKEALEMSVRLGKPKNLGGVGTSVEKPEYSAAIGLMFFAAESDSRPTQKSKKEKQNKSLFKTLFGKFKF